ncbi:MAG: outer membrane beta-barrel protein [Verrucomicrobiae bacterium]|nr:outer membrane beta-barrel protein [Verrucomicrobiae bacterium]
MKLITKFFITVLTVLTSFSSGFAQVQRLEQAPDAPKYKYNGQDGYYYNVDSPVNKPTIRDPKTGFYLGVGMAGSLQDTTTKVNMSPVSTTTEQQDPLSWGTFGKVGYILPGRMLDLPNSPNLFFEIDGSYTHDFNISDANNIRMSTIQLAPLVGMSVPCFQNRFRAYFGAGPSFNLAELKTGSTLQGIPWNMNGTDKLAVGVLGKVGGEYFITDTVSLFGEYAMSFYPSFKYGASTAVNSGNIRVDEYFNNQFRLGIGFHF